MKWLLLILCVAAIAFAQGFGPGKVYFVNHADGHVTIETGELLIRADHGERIPDTGEFTLRGNVSVKMKKPESR